MVPRTTLSSSDFERIRELDTCTVSNAIERLNVRLRNEGFISHAVRCQFPRFAPLLGYAVTGTIRTSATPVVGNSYHDRIGFLQYLSSMPAPRVMVLQDVDRVLGLGALVGEIHAAIAQALDCVGCVTNGAVRDLPAVEAMGFHLFAGSVSISHAYAHIVEFGEPVEIGSQESPRRPGARRSPWRAYHPAIDRAGNSEDSGRIAAGRARIDRFLPVSRIFRARAFSKNDALPLWNIEDRTFWC